MITNIYTIRDKVAEEVGPLFQAKNDAVAIRQFKQLVKDSENPEEYELFVLVILMIKQLSWKLKGKSN